ncbi:MAG: DUF2442 domain-containing protein [Burkholderiales bacterium]|nr:MAG: DUF2442 domain-containing protein [Burkholderiales bacterium]
MIKIVHARWIKDQQIALAFSDGSEGVYDFASLLALKTPLTQPLQDIAAFQKFFLELGALCWPHGLEFSADKLHADLLASSLLHQAAEAA